jgi:peptidoglycan/LPS O-acetylase OafA/YrhL
MMMHHAYRDGRGKNILGNGWTMVSLALAAFVSMHFNLPDILTVLFFPFLLLSGAYGSEGINRVFSTRPLQRLGDWSFSIYLVHQPILITTFKTIALFSPAPVNAGPQPSLPPLWIAWSICLVLIVLILFISYLSYRFLENPARRWINSKAADSPALQVS